MKIVIIDYGAGNTQSVKFALERLGATPVLSDDASVIRSADKIIFPGVGHAKPAMEILKQKNLDTLIPQLQQPVLGICLGMQLMCSFSEEGDTDCLSIFPEKVIRFEPKLKVPHTGWNTATGKWALSDNEAWYYFVHSYYVAASTHTALTCNYITGFSAAIQKNNFYGVQFHPEKSGIAGEQLLNKFLNLET